jgi:hypothetical protein
MSIPNVPPRKLYFVAEFLAIPFELPSQPEQRREIARLLKLVILAPGIADKSRKELHARLNALTGS